MPSKKNYNQFEKRRELVTTVVIFCMACITYIMLSDKSNEIFKNIVDNSFWLLGSVVLGYVFGRTLGDFSGGRSLSEILGKSKETPEKPKEE